ncbi:polysaccharide biosynthesis protein [Desulfosediminicola ganghwensis]|uniref:polysaccharide biosynthesis protein n=1 Tax=Desulfosediminicola ganghwensis TaxID=2569540 RepID=UPI0010AD3C4E|nr:polysaccharide biosynthesis protein [Desulfosediminicola ganghwensis]
MIASFDLSEFINRYVTGRSESLLQADFESYDAELSARINGKNVLVIGGAGSIGSSYIKAILRFKVSKLVVVDISENGLTELVRDLRSSVDFNIPDDFITYPVNFGDKVFEKLFRRLGPFDIVANFAAHKHVRSEKDVFSIEAMVENNVLRARRLLDLLLECPPEHFFCVSTDKAANPVNVMGASKKLMEELIMAYADRLPIKTARFANVAFSNGSLPLGFLERLNKRQPWSCPLGIRRFFVSPQESGELCLIASIMGESGDIFFPKLDAEKDMVPFDRIAKDLLEDLGLELDACTSEEEARQKALKLSTVPASWPVYFFGSDTSGEKSYEEFFTDGEELDNESFVNLGVIKNSLKRDKAEIDMIFDKLNDLFATEEVSKAAVVEILKTYLPNFSHIETGKGLDSKM